MARKDISDIQVIKAYLQSRAEGMSRFPDEILQEITGQCKKVCYRAMERAYEREYIDYGTSLRSGWVTEKGMVLLKT